MFVLRKKATAIAFAITTLIIGSCGLSPTSGRTSIGTGTTAVLANVVDPDDGSKPIVDFIGQAAKTVDMEVYLLSDHSVMDALVEAKDRGATVRVILEEHPYGAGEGNGAIFRQLQAAGIQAEWSNPAFKYTHEKAIVVDGRLALIMTQNLTRSAFVNNREFAVVDADETDVAEVQAIFDADWKRQPANPSAPNLIVSPTNSRQKLLNLIDEAQSGIDVYSEEMQDRGIEDALAGAVKRGVRVRVILPAPAARQQDANELGRAAILQGGVDVHLLAKPYVHAKVILVDGRTAFVGSENLSGTSLDHNREMGVIVADVPTVARIEGVFERDWSR